MKPILLLAPLLAAASAASAPAVLDTHWSAAAAKAYVALSDQAKTRRSLPELRVYDADNRLVLRSFGLKPGKVGSAIVQAVRRRAAVSGPSFAESLAELETRDGRPASAQAQAQAQAQGRGKITIVDYWAVWCAPCKALGAELDSWAARQPAGYVRIVRAETDFIAAERAAGHEVRHFIQGPDGKRTEVDD